MNTGDSGVTALYTVYIVIWSAISFEKGSGTQKVTQNSVREGGVSYTNARKEKGSRTPFRLVSF
jgi:hypothetical protein